MSIITTVLVTLLSINAYGQISSEKVVKCQHTFLQSNENIFGTQTKEIVLKQLADTQPTYEKWGAEWNETIIVGKDKSKQFTIKSYVSLQARGSLWFTEPRYRMQIFGTVLDMNGKVLSVFRDHTDRVVRDYQLEEIKKDNPTLRLAIPSPFGLEQVYSAPEISAVLAEKGPEAAYTLAIRKKLIDPETVREMGVLCYLR